jgi:hypothetical protein
MFSSQAAANVLLHQCYYERTLLENRDRGPTKDGVRCGTLDEQELNCLPSTTHRAHVDFCSSPSSYTVSSCLGHPLSISSPSLKKLYFDVGHDSG